MVERGAFEEFYKEKLKEYVNTLAGWDRNIIEIAAIENLYGNNHNHKGHLTLICTFDPEPTSDHNGLFSVINLMLRDDYEEVSINLDIPYAIDIGFAMGNKIHLPTGDILDKPENSVVLWPPSDYAGEGVK